MTTQLRSITLAFATSLCISLGAPAAANQLVVQGQLDEFGAPANGRFDLQLVAHRDATLPTPRAGALVLEDVDIRDGQFRVTPDFGLELGVDDAVWIAVAVRDGASTGAFSAIPARIKAVTPQAIGQCWSSTGDSGSNPNINFLGTTDGQPLVLRSAAGVAINTTAARDMLTLRGPSDFLAGPTVQLLGTSADQAESGRIRFVEGTATGNLRGAFIRYDGAQNLLSLGAHNGNDNLLSSQVDHLVVRRQSSTQVGIGMVPTETLDVDGDIRLNGGLKYANLLSHVKNWAGSLFHETGEASCTTTGGATIRKKSGVVLSSCVATASAEFPEDALLTRIFARFDDESSGENCLVRFQRVDVTTSTNFVGSLATLNSSGSGGTQFVSADLNSAVSRNNAYSLTFVSDSNECSLVSVRVTYELPNGFLP